MNYDALRELICFAEEYEKSTGILIEKEGLSAFFKWLYQKTKPKEELDIEPIGETLDSIIGKFIGYMYRFSKFYVKKSLENSPLTTLDDFTYLGSIMLKEGSSKTEIIDSHIHEKTTGTEIIKRLKKNNFLEEKPSEHDKRSKALFITPEGREVFFVHVRQMQQIGELITGDLNESEKHELVSLLSKLNDFHQELYHQNKKENIETILSLRANI